MAAFQKARLPDNGILNAGKIASYVHPMRLFMCITLVFFIFFFMVLGQKAETVFDDNPGINEEIELYGDNGPIAPEQEFIDKFLGDLSSYSPIISLLFVPIMAFLLKLLYRRNHMKYMSHLAFLKTAIIYLFYFIASVFFVALWFTVVYSSLGKDYGLL